MLEKILTANVDDESNFRPDRRDIREVLLGPNADIGAASTCRTYQRWYDALKRTLVGNEVVRTEEAIRFGKLGDHLPEFGVGNFRRQPLSEGLCGWRQQRQYRDQRV